MKTAQLIVAGTDLWHDLLAGGRAMERVLLDSGMHATLRVGLERFAAEWEPKPDVYVLNTMEPRISAAGLKALSDKIASGTGLVALHATNVGAMDSQGDLFRLVGSHFVNHPPFTRFPVRPTKAHPVMKGVEEFLADDEPYEVELIQNDCEVVAEGEWGGQKHPIVYVRKHGTGRICYIALGHDGRIWANPGFKKLLCQAASWAAGE